MDDFSNHEVISDLINSLGSSTTVQECVKLINNSWDASKSHSSNSALQVPDKHLQEVIKNSPTPQLFLHKYNELVEKKVDSLGSFVEMMYIINKDPTLKKLLKQTCKPKKASTPTNLTETLNISELKSKLFNAVCNEQNTTSKLSPSKPSSSQQNIEQAIYNVSNDRSSSKVQPSKHHSDIQNAMKWMEHRPNLSWDFTNDPADISTSLHLAIPTISQEHQIIDDLLYILMGVEGPIIKPVPVFDTYGKREFVIQQDISKSYRGLVQTILPLASNYSIVQRFTEERFKFEYGQVNHALVAAIDVILKDYLLFICQMETNYRVDNLTLQKLWFFVQRNMLTMGLMADVASSIGKSNAKGGKVLTLLHDVCVSYVADPRAYDLCLYLSQRAAEPYMNMLATWIFTGIINDPFEEFLVEDNQILAKSKEPIAYADDFWEKRYSVRIERTPSFLEKISDVILKTGKYLNVVRQCGKAINTEEVPLKYHPKDPSYIAVINEAYFTASRLLQELLMQENDLIGRLRSVKRYFLLEQGDFIVQFMDLCEKELSKDISKVVVPRLEALFELALRLSVANNDPYKDDMRIELLPYDLQFQMCKILSIHTQDEADYRTKADEMAPLTGLESFSFGYEVKWPISLVLNRRAIACYQMIFRHLFFCKHVEREICRVWICNKAAKTFAHADAVQYRGAFALRQRMLNCVQNLEYHMMVEVIEPYWQSFRDKINKLVDIDEILKCHNDFLDMCLTDCMLTNPVLLRLVTKLLQISVEFCAFIQQMRRYYVDAELSSMISSTHDATDHLWQSTEHSLSNSMSASMSASMFQIETPQVESSMNDSESFEQSIKRFDLQFSQSLLSLMEKISELARKNTNDKLVNLLYRLDFNSFYGSELEQLYAFGYNDVSG